MQLLREPFEVRLRVDRLEILYRRGEVLSYRLSILAPERLRSFTVLDHLLQRAPREERLDGVLTLRFGDGE